MAMHCVSCSIRVPQVLSMSYSWPMEEDDMVRRMRENAEQVERRLKAEQRYEHRLWSISITFLIVFVVVDLPTQNEWLPFIAASLAAAFVNLLLRESHRIDDN